MADFYLDHDVAVRVALELRALGHHATTARDLGQEQAHDADQLLTAATRDWMLVSHNRKDSRLLHHAWLTWRQAWRAQMDHTGVLVIPQAQPEDSARRLHEFTVTHSLPISNEMYEYTSAGWRPSPGR